MGCRDAVGEASTLIGMCHATFRDAYRSGREATIRPASGSVPPPAAPPCARAWPTPRQVNAFVEDYKSNCRPFAGTGTAESILAQVERIGLFCRDGTLACASPLLPVGCELRRLIGATTTRGSSSGAYVSRNNRAATTGRVSRDMLSDRLDEHGALRRRTMALTFMGLTYPNCAYGCY